VDAGTPGERSARRVVSFGKPGAHKFKIESGSMLEEVL
jgi:hypothetical protein